MAVASAFAIESIHTYSLIHDDLPAMDNDDERRGKPCNHKVYGEAVAILAGNSLQVLAYEVLSLYSFSHKSIYLLSQAIGASGLLGGQFLDIEYTKPFKKESEEPISEDIIRHIMKLKTAKLFEISVSLPFIEINEAIIQNKSASLFSLPHSKLLHYSQKIEKVQQWGLELGSLFQLIDDYQDRHEDIKGTNLNIFSCMNKYDLILMIHDLSNRLSEEAGTYFDNSFLLKYLPIHLAKDIK